MTTRLFDPCRDHSFSRARREKGSTKQLQLTGLLFEAQRGPCTACHANEITLERSLTNLLLRTWKHASMGQGWWGEMAPSPSSVIILHQLQHSSIPPSYIQTIHLIENCTYLHNVLIGPINYNNNGTAAATETPAAAADDQRPTARTYTCFPFHSTQPNRPNPCFMPSVQILRCSST